jgi:hypothetical protein
LLAGRFEKLNQERRSQLKLLNETLAASGSQGAVLDRRGEQHISSVLGARANAQLMSFCAPRWAADFFPYVRQTNKWRLEPGFSWTPAISDIVMLRARPGF